MSMAFIPKEYSNTILALYLVSTVFAGASKYQLTLGAIFILRKDIGVGGWSRKQPFSLTLCSKSVLR